MNLKDIFLDDKHLVPKPAKAGRGRAPKPQPATATHSMLLGGISVVLVALVLSIIFSKGTADPITINPETFCPVDKQYIAQETYVHIDLSERLNEDQRRWLKNLLSVAQLQLPPRSLFAISQMQTKARSPRVEVQRFCVPDIKDIDVAGKRIKKDDCPEIAEDEFDWSQNRTRHIGEAQREKITVACENYVELKEKVQKAAERYDDVSVAQNRSYIVGGIEDVVIASKHAGNPGIPTHLIVFSDMLQNAKWFSQYSTSSEDWSAKNLKKLRKNEAAIDELGGKPPSEDRKFNKVLLCVIPSAHSVLASARSRRAHEKMWEDYFVNRVVSPISQNFHYIEAAECAVTAEAVMR